MKSPRGTPRRGFLCRRRLSRRHLTPTHRPTHHQKHRPPTMLTIRKQINSPILRPGELNRALAKVVAKTTFDYEREVKQAMAAPKHGRTYRRAAVTRAASRFTRAAGLRERTTKGGRARAVVGSKFHRASAPGEAPAVDSSVLINSIQSKATGLRGRLTVSAAHAEPVERKRPVFGPTLERFRPRFTRDVSEEVGRLCRG
ncbi:MAG: hypothetical protein M3458_14810 [Acidobacteriota bacterium]|nr:hypothetical protein [Acidobacteriota bacterium]